MRLCSSDLDRLLQDLKFSMNFERQAHPKKGEQSKLLLYPSSMEPRSFKLLFCQRFACPAEQYEGRALRELLYQHAKPIAPVLQFINPKAFAKDLLFLRDLGEATDLQEANQSAAEFQDSNGSNREIWRSLLRIRVSGLKGVRLAQELFKYHKKTGNRADPGEPR